MVSQPQLVHGHCVLELGAGTGLAGIAAGHAASHVLLTDLSPMLPLCQVSAFISILCSLSASLVMGGLHRAFALAPANKNIHCIGCASRNASL